MTNRARSILNSKQCLLGLICGFLLIISPSIHAAIKGEQGYLKINGAKIFYQVFGRGDPIIALHGGPGLESGYLLPQMLELAQAHKVVFYDQRGTGKSLATPINERTINMKQYLSDLDAIKTKLGFNKIVLIGHNFGGLLAMQYATQYPRNVAALILVNTLPATNGGFLKFAQEYDRRMASIVPTLSKMQESPEFKQGDPDVMEKYYRTLFERYVAKPESAQSISLQFTNQSALAGLKVAAILQKTYLSTKYNLLPELRQLRIPVLIIHGREDIVPLKSAKEINKTVKGSELVIFNNCGNFAYVEQSEAFFEAVNAFLENIKAWR